MDVLVVSHTHWDREWYHGVGRFRQRLVALVDELLDAPADARVPFLLDGQAVVLEDYLALRPEREPTLRDALRGGAIEAGPWYVLADELIPGGESLVRNLLVGRALLTRLGAAAPPVLHSPDAFGHPAALPAIGAGFGLSLSILWRGYGGARWPSGDTVRWAAPDGTTIVLHHLPRGGYEVGSNMPTDEAAARARWSAMRAELAPRARLDLALVPNGADHHALQRDAGAALDALARAAAPGDVARRASLGEAAREILRRAADVALPAVRGELRDSYGYTWTLQGTLATRAAQKRRAAAVERLLLRDAEPWLALAPLRAAGAARASLAGAWRTLLRCHPHDTLCGCSTDGVARAMDARLASAAEQARGVRDDALASLLGHDAVEARERRAEWRPVLVVRNRAARTRRGVAEVELLTFTADEAVGPGSGAMPSSPPDAWPDRWSVDGGRVPLQPLAERLDRDRTESPRHYPDNDLVRRTIAVAWLDDAVPALGLLALPLGERDAASAAPALPPDVAPAVADGDRLANGLCEVAVDDAGRVALHAADGRALPDLLGFESVGDAGDTYTHSPIPPRLDAPAYLGAHVVHRGPLRATIELRWRFDLPARASRRGRARRTVAVPLRVRLSLDAGSPLLGIAVSGRNLARDHRLRLVIRTDVRGGVVHADAAFGPVRRDPIDVPPEDRAAESPPPTAPLHRHVSLADAHAGATVISDGLAEYEATAEGAVAITLVRAVGALSRNDLPERPGHAGWPVDTPRAQSLHRFRARVALLVHGPRDDAVIAAVERAADDALLPLAATTLRSALHLPAPVRGVELRGHGLALSAVKPSEDGDALVLRCVNLLDRAVRGAWVLGRAPTTARRARLDETPLDALALDGATIRFEAAAREVVTVLVR